MSNESPKKPTEEMTAEAYLARLIRAGFKVAICDQTEGPAEARRRGNKGPVRRAVTRLVTAGTLTEEGLLDARRNNYLAGIAEAGGEMGLAWLERGGKTTAA